MRRLLILFDIFVDLTSILHSQTGHALAGNVREKYTFENLSKPFVTKLYKSQNVKPNNLSHLLCIVNDQ